MSDPTFEDIVVIYEKNRAPSIIRHRIEYPTFGDFCINLDYFDKSLGDLANENYWRTFLFPLKKLRFGLSAAPFTIDERNRRIAEISDNLKRYLHQCHLIYPSFAQAALSLIESLEKLLQDASDPLFEKLLELTPVDQTIAWIIKESRLIPDAEAAVANLDFPFLKVIHPLQLKDVTCYEQIIAVGPSRWFPESIFSAVRSDQIHIIIFDWIKDRWMPQEVFASPHKSSGSSSRTHIAVEERETNNLWENLDPESLLYLMDRLGVIKSAATDNDRDEYEDIEAICIFMEGDLAIFLDASESSKIHVIDLEADIENRIARISIDNLEIGMFVLVRTSGGGDYIIPFANKIMGDIAMQARQYQQHWKERLRSYVKTRGLFETCIDLLDLGSRIANETNVRNWMSPSSIRTRDYADFSAIMKIIEMEADAEHYWKMMGLINRAHRSAGFKIRDLLIEQVRDIDVDLLHKQGRVDFKISDDDDGGLTAFRVESVMKEKVRIPYSRLGQPFKLDQQ
ncbi:MAG: hypothetical protein K8L91_21965 [Anaerolineae bacterium]|nr:hypothetical protein [Anaerolineae bacterium]